jgi:hypothetical protein
LISNTANRESSLGLSLSTELHVAKHLNSIVRVLIHWSQPALLLEITIAGLGP